MSSRKRKKRSRVDDAVEATASDAQAVPSAAADEESGEESTDEVGVEPVEPETDEPVSPPAVSEISELKPRRKKKRAKEEEPEPDPAAVETTEVEASEAEEDEGEEEELPDTAKEAPKTPAQLRRVIESLIFVSDQVITAQQLGRITKAKIGDVREALAELSVEYEGRGIDLIEVNGGYQFRSAAASAPYVRVLVAQKPVRLTRAQLETLALIAYRQPITRPEVDDVRGVDSGSAIKVLLERDLIKILGRKDDAGRPLLYGTTPFFLEFFGMNTMQELPTLREFTELSDEHRELFKAKTNDIGDPSAEAEFRLSNASGEEVEVQAQEPAESEPERHAEAEIVEADPETWDAEASVDAAGESATVTVEADADSTPDAAPRDDGELSDPTPAADPEHDA